MVYYGDTIDPTISCAVLPAPICVSGAWPRHFLIYWTRTSKERRKSNWIGSTCSHMFPHYHCRKQWRDIVMTISEFSIEQHLRLAKGDWDLAISMH